MGWTVFILDAQRLTKYSPSPRKGVLNAVTVDSPTNGHLEEETMTLEEMREKAIQLMMKRFH